MAVLALLAAYKQSGNPKYLTDARTIGNWIAANLADPSTTGFYVVYNDGGLPKSLILGKSTADNSQIFAAFTRLAQVEHDLAHDNAATVWTTLANSALDFVKRMFDRTKGRFNAGTTIALNLEVFDTSDSLDSDTLAILGTADPNQFDWRSTVQYLLNNFVQSNVTVGSLTFSGFELVPPQAGTPMGIALESTAQALLTMKRTAAAYNTGQFAAPIGAYASEIRKVQTSGPFGDGHGLVAAVIQNGDQLPPYKQCLRTPFACLPERVGLASTAWAIFADLNVNPFTLFGPPILSISKTHVGNFARGQQSASYLVTVSNTPGQATTSGLVTVTDTLPTGLTLVSMAGTGWTCIGNACTRSDALAGGANYPAIAVTVNVSGTATSPQINQVSVSGGGSATANASDSTIIGLVQPTLSVSRKVLNFGISGALITSPQTVVVTITGGANVAWTATTSDNPNNITVNPSSGIGTGTFQISAVRAGSGTVTVSAPGAINSPQIINVNVTFAVPTFPFGNVDTPVNGTTGVVGAIPITGWALDNIEVTRVDIFREPVTGEAPGNLIFIGNAVFSADARPDVAAAFPTYPYQYRAGWGYQMLRNFLPNASGPGAPGNDTYKIHAIAFNKAGLQFDIGTKTITVDNAHTVKPFGTIDTPTQGGTISGADSVNFGWALTPQPGMIPIDGSTITVVIDGMLVGHPVYNQYRPDIANLFPGYANSGGAVGFFHINTLTLANGVHTISWNVVDNLSRAEGVGSRYFNVLNTGGSTVAAPEDVIDESVAREAVGVRHGLNVNRRPDLVAQDSDGGYSVTMEEVGLIELHLGAAGGNMLVEGEARELPTGSTLKGGIFYWQPGPGFLGQYTMQFTRLDGTKIQVRVNIVPKRYALE